MDTMAIDYSIFVFLLLVCQLAPENGKNIIITSSTQNEPLYVEYLKKEKIWTLSERGKSGKFYLDKKKEKLIITLDGESKELPLKDFLKTDKKINWKKIDVLELKANLGDSEQSPISIKRNKNNVTFSQEKGFLSDLKQIKMSWE